MKRKLDEMRNRRTSVMHQITEFTERPSIQAHPPERATSSYHVIS